MEACLLMREHRAAAVTTCLVAMVTVQGARAIVVSVKMEQQEATTLVDMFVSNARSMWALILLGLLH